MTLNSNVLHLGHESTAIAVGTVAHDQNMVAIHFSCVHVFVSCVHILAVLGLRKQGCSLFYSDLVFPKRSRNIVIGKTKQTVILHKKS